MPNTLIIKEEARLDMLEASIHIPCHSEICAAIEESLRFVEEILRTSE